MKKRNRFVAYFVLVLLMVAFVACASTSKQESTGQYVDDSVITTKVKALLAADDFLKSFEISVETYKGTVQLSGFVGSQEAADKAGEITRSVKRFKSVSEIGAKGVLGPPSFSAASLPYDEQDMEMTISLHY
jgi:hypothetical protein